ncbi:cupin-like domain-containing protein [Marinagarivorans algicola]|uniref:cupin-like domain-containing protein n=1 Tax=Marinagarivorans algicola TaxID=1513270 RepID=UPI0006B675E7|nr:cupin-like domain-containing protein [Marinagarivorans algicola]
MLVNKKTRVIEGAEFNDVDFNALIESGEPCVLKGALSHAPLVLAGKQSYLKAKAHLISHVGARPMLSYVAAAGAAGRFFYNQDLTGFNFSTEYLSLEDFFEKIEISRDLGDGTTFYVGSAELEGHFPGLLESDCLNIKGDVFKTYSPQVGIWLGNKTTAVTHYDVSNNVAACLVGRRRFTLFPPSQIANLYPGPLEPTPGGQAVSMFDLKAPDFIKYPKAREALKHGQIAELGPGDVLVYPAMWWHQVDALDDFNVMINYWWNTSPSFIDDPSVTLLHALLSLRDRPESEKKAWREIFDYYIFGDASKPCAHLPEYAQGLLATIDPITARRLRAKLIKKINR